MVYFTLVPLRSLEIKLLQTCRGENRHGHSVIFLRQLDKTVSGLGNEVMPLGSPYRALFVAPV